MGKRPRSRRGSRPSERNDPSRTIEKPASSWGPVAPWYDHWVGRRGSPHHRHVAIPTVLRLAELRPGHRVLDVGCGQGVLARHVLAAGAAYTGIDASREMLDLGRARHGPDVGFVHADARRLGAVAGLVRQRFDVAVFLLSLQDMNPLSDVVSGVAALLAPHGRLVAFMTHPCFRVPRASGWGYDHRRKLPYRRVEGYLSERRVPMRAHAEVSSATRGATLSYHRPLAAYVDAFAHHGLFVDALEEVVDPLVDPNDRTRSRDIPTFLAIRARRPT
jgi:SAM-dependent methyltransferase